MRLPPIYSGHLFLAAEAVETADSALCPAIVVAPGAYSGGRHDIDSGEGLILFVAPKLKHWIMLAKKEKDFTRHIHGVDVLLEGDTRNCKAEQCQCAHAPI